MSNPEDSNQFPLHAITNAVQTLEEANPPDDQADVKVAVGVVMDAAAALLVTAKAHPDDPSRTFLGLLVAYQSLYVLGQVGEAVLASAMMAAPGELETVRTTLQQEIRELVARLTADS
jgi:hypothetical protein